MGISSHETNLSHGLQGFKSVLKEKKSVLNNPKRGAAVAYGEPMHNNTLLAGMVHIS
jgi:hypothetical protein